MMSSISFIVMLLVMIMIPTILYSFFFLINCPPNPFELLRRRSANVENTDPRRSKMAEEEDDDDKNSNKDKNKIELVIASSSKLGKEAECPVCLAVYVEGEELRQLNYCKHLFHRSCIDKWLSTHCNCPVCRAFVGNHSKLTTKERESRVLASRHHHLWQGLPDSVGLV